MWQWFRFKSKRCYLAAFLQAAAPLLGQLQKVGNLLRRTDIANKFPPSTWSVWLQSHLKWIKAFSSIWFQWCKSSMSGLSLEQPDICYCDRRNRSLEAKSAKRLLRGHKDTISSFLLNSYSIFSNTKNETDSAQETEWQELWMINFVNPRGVCVCLCVLCHKAIQQVAGLRG